MAYAAGNSSGSFHSDPLSPARRAAVLMFLLGLLGIFGGVCVAGIGWLLHDFITQPQFAVLLRNTTASVLQLQTRIIFIGVICIVGGACLGIMGLFVRRGTAAPIIASIVLTIFALLVATLIFGGSLFATKAQEDATLLSVIFMLAMPVVLLVVLLIWLMAALRSVEDLRSLEARICQPRMDTNEHE